MLLRISFNRALLFLLASLWAHGSLSADYLDSYTARGHLKINGTHTRFDDHNLQDALGISHTSESGVDGRLNLHGDKGPFQFIIEGVLNHRVFHDRPVAGQIPVPFQSDSFLYPTDRRSLLDLTDVLSNSGNSISVARLDRLSLGWGSENGSIRLGRQALTWGQGLAFQALDIFNPFAPASVDKEYKPGDDMVVGTLQPTLGSQLEFVYVPRRDPLTHDIEGDESSFGSRVNHRIADSEMEIQFLAAYHYSDLVGGLGINGELLSSIWRIDLSLVHTDLGENFFQLVGNIDRSWELIGKNWYGFLEYFYNGFGTASGDYDHLSNDLLDRVGRGELYTLAESYAALGLRQEVTPLLNLHQLALFNFNDHSSLVQLQVAYDVKQNLILTGAATAGLGGNEAEFQGIRVNEAVIGRGDSLFLQLGYYF